MVGLEHIHNILFIGMPVVDILIDLEDPAKVIEKHLIIPGERNMLLADEVALLEAEFNAQRGVQVFAGGSLANTASSAMRLCPDIKASFFAACADESYGDIFGEAIVNAGMTWLPETRIGTETSRSYVVVDNKGERGVARYLGNSMSSIAASMLESHIREADMIVLEGELPALPNGVALWRDCLALAKKHKTAVAMTLFGAEQVRLHRALFEDAIQHYADYVFGNEEELFALFDGTPPSFKEACQYYASVLSARAPHAVLCISHGTNAPYLHMVESVFSDKAAPVDVFVNTLGAGDGFMAGVLSGLLLGLAGNEVLALGHKVASEVIQQDGAMLDHATIQKIRQGLLLETSPPAT